MVKCYEAIRKESEKCDKVENIIMTYSINGGTGSGIGVLMKNYLKTEYPK